MELTVFRVLPAAGWCRANVGAHDHISRPFPNFSARNGGPDETRRLARPRVREPLLELNDSQPRHRDPAGSVVGAPHRLEHETTRQKKTAAEAAVDQGELS